MGVLSGGGVVFFFLPADLSLPVLLFDPAFFLPDFAFGVAAGVFEGLAEGFGFGVLSSSSSESEVDLGVLLALRFGFGVGESSESTFALEGVFAGLGVALFFFFGDDVGVGDADFACLTDERSPLSVSSSLTCACKNEATSAVSARAVAMRRRMRATAAHRNRVSDSFKPAAEQGEPVSHERVPVPGEQWRSVFHREAETNR